MKSGPASVLTPQVEEQESEGLLEGGTATEIATYLIISAAQVGTPGAQLPATGHQHRCSRDGRRAATATAMAAVGQAGGKHCMQGQQTSGYDSLPVVFLTKSVPHAAGRAGHAPQLCLPAVLNTACALFHAHCRCQRHALLVCAAQLMFHHACTFGCGCCRLASLR